MKTLEPPPFRVTLEVPSPRSRPAPTAPDDAPFGAVIGALIGILISAPFWGLLVLAIALLLRG
jgi:hypothetical protein